jgi:hypothetical protein
MARALFPFLLSCIVLLLPGWATSVSAQPKGIQYGWGDKVVHVADLPAEVRGLFQKEMGPDVAIGFFYRHWFLFGDGFDFWTWDGKYVLFTRNEYWPMPEEGFKRILGPERFAALGQPLTYRFPAGLATVLALVAGFSGWLYFFPPAPTRAAKLLQDQKYQEGFALYCKNLPSETEPSAEQRAQALAVAATFLQEHHGIPEEEASSKLLLLAAEMVRQRSYELRDMGRYHEELGEWDEAIDCYQKAAAVRQDWDAKDHAFLLTCIERVRKKRGPAPKDDQEDS